MKKQFLTLVIFMLAFSLMSCSSTLGSSGTSSSNGYHTSLWDGRAANIWERLQQTSSSTLASMERTTPDPEKKAWLQLALISKHSSTNTSQLAHELINWRAQNPSHPGNALLPNGTVLAQLQNSPPPRQIAILLPQHGPFGSSGQTVREGFLNAYYANLANVGKQNVKFFDTSRTTNMNALYEQAKADGADFVIGPLLKENVQALSQSGSFSTPTLALNYTTIRFGSLPTNYYEFGLLPEDETSQIADHAYRSGRSRAIIIAPQNAWGTRLVSAFTSRWQSEGGKVVETWYYQPNTDFNQGLAQLLHVDSKSTAQTKDANNSNLPVEHRNDFDVVFLFAQSQEAHIIVPMLRYYYVNTPIYATSSVYSGRPNPTKDVDLNGILICDIPGARQAVHDNSEGVPSGRLYAVGQDAYLLSQTLNRLIQLPNFPIYGKTGALTLASNHQIHRRIPCSVVRNGVI